MFCTISNSLLQPLHCINLLFIAAYRYTYNVTFALNWKRNHQLIFVHQLPKIQTGLTVWSATKVTAKNPATVVNFIVEFGCKIAREFPSVIMNNFVIRSLYTAIWFVCVKRQFYSAFIYNRQSRCYYKTTWSNKLCFFNWSLRMKKELVRVICLW